ncbi:substrate-binding periplasmic protein [Aliidiomarina sanyensis]|uniref:Amino acid ABC transporter substrate-binding protein n=1 Tax=Aliidiomarina sanyensis TaxID=1249555 RepID=A0A432WGB2_9GAMM|nr:transporter substrate-binding domain-containing protein [Aliidiomarina sanyensis]RUO32866.1 amino acid ABC transporter substrate-binding protein [Aliidiomarina sanyensis]
MRRLSNWLLAVFVVTLTACSPAERQEIQAPEHGVTEAEMTDVQASHCQLTMGFESWEPYQYLSPGGEVGGVDFEIAQQAFSHMNCTLRVEQGSWMELLELLQNGDIDFLMGASRTEAREQFAYFSVPYRDEQFSLFVRGDRRNRFDQSTVEEFVAAGYRVGVVNEYYYGEELQSLMYDSDYTSQFIGSMINELNVARVLDGEIDGFLEDNLVASSIIRRRGLGALIDQHAISLPSTEVYVMFSRASVDDEFVEQFNDALQVLVDDGYIEHVIARYSIY